MLITSSKHRGIVESLRTEVRYLEAELKDFEATIKDLEAKIKIPATSTALREFTIKFKKGTPIKIIGSTVDANSGYGFAVKTVVNGENRVVHWFAEQPIEWSSRWL